MPQAAYPGRPRPRPRLRPRRRRRGINPNSRPRLVLGRTALVLVLGLAGLRLVDVQAFQAPELSAKAEQQRATKVYIPAQRGTISDRNGTKLAFSVDAKALYAQPKQLLAQWNDPQNAKQHAGVTFEQHTQAIADEIARLVGSSVNEQDLLTKLRSTTTSFSYLAWPVDPAVAAKITKDFPEIGAEDRSWRVYPDGTVASNIIGDANWRMNTTPPGLHGVLGLENSMDAQLAGRAGVEWVDTQQGDNQVVIPNTVRDVTAAVPGESVQLTIDSDVQYELQQKLAEYVAKTGAKDGSAVVLDAHTGQIYALANDTSFNPNDPNSLAKATPAQLGDAAVTTPYEPGSVNKIVTAAAAIDQGLVTPTSLINIPSELHVADRVIHDDWVHPNQTYTVTGVFAKSSNIGADELAQKVGEQNFYNMLMKMGLGQKTGVELPGESAGFVPAMNQWSGSTFGNLPIGQGLSMTVLQMAGMYQAIANDGVRVPPRIIESVTEPDGTVVKTPQPAGVRVVSPQAAQTVRMMMRAVTQNARTPQEGTGVSAAIPGYQISGKTGTAQQVDPKCGCYSYTKNTVTFAGILSADNPRFVVGIMLDAPSDGAEGGQTAAPLFHEIASYLAQKYQLPVSSTPTPYVTLVQQ